ncbi:hypothetical protein DYB25_010015 [Aphanomyces astaci]|uniref:MORN repeat-containing protein 3 n=1 Tax=Aphanomyces astaci TaxID=112090 RepID=A0A397B3Y4_APHAT|nr:hypothetical protein DYB25_010015 [Aphanomyces astaci]RHY57619.1 hypothetical protein DYB38_000740 [Aphanomyces astaci]RHZ00834.1 hypothetical protein DYB26_001793 [Aphanomyces astaci]RHZ14757.1 hypothetical protein DYB31_006218 [Aphanomyces astaci]
MSRPSPRVLAATPSSPMSKKEATNPLWKTWDAKSVKSGAHHSVYWVKQGSTSNEDKFGHVEVGKSTFVQAAKYTGDWHDDVKSGYGTQLCASGNKYEGEWKDGCRHGKANGNRYEGYWLHDQKEGPGRFYYMSTGKVYEAEWQNDTAKCGLELAAPESVLNDTILRLREARLKDQVTSSQSPTSVVFTLSQETQRRVHDEFHAIDFNRKGVIRCVDVVQILTSLVGEEEEANSDLHVRVEALLGELGASYDTAITLPECMDIVALLMEPDEPSETKPHRGPDNGHKG